MANEIIETIYKRRSIRRYSDKEVELEKLDILLKVAMAAPTACNNQSWEFVVITDKGLLAKLRKHLEYGPYEAPGSHYPPVITPGTFVTHAVNHFGHKI